MASVLQKQLAKNFYHPVKKNFKPKPAKQKRRQHAT